MTEDEAKIIFLSERIEKFLNMAGSQGECRGCGRAIWWIAMPSGKKAPITHDLLNHFADCPKAKMFRK